MIKTDSLKEGFFSFGWQGISRIVGRNYKNNRNIVYELNNETNVGNNL